MRKNGYNKKGAKNPLNNMIKIELEPHEVIKMMSQSSINSNKIHIQFLNEAMDKIKSNKPSDRMESAVALELIIKIMDVSINRWKNWCNLNAMNLITEKEFKKLLPQIRGLALKWLEIDKKITEDKTIEMEKELKNYILKAPKQSKNKERKDIYVT